MSNTKKLLQVRKTIKSKKPEFLQQDFHKKKRLSAKWKRPTGLHSKMRHQFKGYGRRVKQGWRSPVEIRGFHGKGLKPVTINNVKELSAVKKDEGIIIAKSVGDKKRLEIIKKAEELKLIVLNIKVESFKEKVSKKEELKKKEKAEKQDKKKKSLEESLKKAKKKEAAESEEDKKKEEKKEKDDVLIHKQ